jgi:RimJ/RimL family protein N-acetyltransferase
MLAHRSVDRSLRPRTHRVWLPPLRDRGYEGHRRSRPCDTPLMDHSSPVSVPRLQTRRLLLREYRAEDFDAFAAHLDDPGSTAFIGSADRQTAWRIFGCHTGLWLLHGAGWWAVELRETGQLVGTVGAFIREGLAGIEIGWNTYEAFRGQGFASEAGAEAVRYALTVRGEPQVRAFIDPGNTPSIRVAQSLGMRYEAEADLYGKAVRRYTCERAPVA